MSLSRRQMLIGTASIGAAAGLGAAFPAMASAAPAGFPDYRFVRTTFDKAKLRYNPTGELIFPCIRGVSGRVANPLGRYYLYYAPHDPPGGICLAYADSLEGPFTEYPHNPIVSRDWPGKYSVSHVSSPHVMWHEEAKELWLYFHGENTVTRLARSKDGIHFGYDKEVLSTRLLPEGTTETSYARVFRHDLPSKKARYVMVFMLNNKSDHRDIGWGWSADARNWTFAKEPLIRHGDVGANNVGGPHLLWRDNSTYVVYNTNIEAGGNILITEVGNDFTKREHLGVFHRPLAGAPDGGRCAAPSFGTENGREYMIYEAGARLEGSIAIARA
ncbi:hypothetical protein [Amycolatopsis sp. CA-230715]|uniref:hypothetical protein n=1 Tax=Amycolatopsis sp. CA-230715 TaxID=2745196 RepID=UPI001C33BCE3|nr:hypothetical protein [Amycolatopsis sp. CA-230715]QWF85999.1 hypothetical protein HUW46_09480 [Amycolatopsis sp. CA-230715]